MPVEIVNKLIDMALRGAYIFCRWDNLYDLPKPKSCICWVKNGGSMGDLNHEHGRAWEACLFYNKQLHEFKKRITDVIHCNRTGNKYHPTEKPVELIKRIIDCNVCDLIMDPFIGSGTTAIACEQLNKKWIGIEIDQKHAEVAKKRILDESNQIKMIF